MNDVEIFKRKRFMKQICDEVERGHQHRPKRYSWEAFILGIPHREVSGP